jgi:hypothetical protein
MTPIREKSLIPGNTAVKSPRTRALFKVLGVLWSGDASLGHLGTVGQRPALRRRRSPKLSSTYGTSP